MLLIAGRLLRAQQLILMNLDPPLTYRQYRILARIHGGETSAAALRRIMGLSAPAMSESVESLVRRGFLRREPSAEDRRAIVLDMTDAGHRAFQEADRQVMQLAEQVMQGAPDDATSDAVVGFLEHTFSVATQWREAARQDQ